MTTQTESFATQCQASGTRLGLGAIPWAQLIQALLAALTGCIPMKRRAAVRLRSSNHRWQNHAVAQKIATDAGVPEEEAGIVADVMVTTAAELSQDEAEKLVSETPS